MRALTLTQPWASLVAVGAKRMETRGWTTRHRGPLAIHAAVGLEPVGGMKGLIETVGREPFASVLREHFSGYTDEEVARELPRGAIVAVASLTDVVRTERMNFAMKVVGLDLPEHVEHEHAFGDFSPGRFAWLFERVTYVANPIECKGALGLWKLPRTVCDELAEVDLRAHAIEL